MDTSSADHATIRHARLWPGQDRAACTGAIVPAEMLRDRDEDVTCKQCRAIAGWARGDN